MKIASDSHDSVETDPGHAYSPIYAEAGIRLLIIFAGRPQDALSAAFAFEFLHPETPREQSWTAISYAWEGETRSERLKIDDDWLPITPSVARILRDLRNPDDHIFVWIDAICINQDNQHEKAAQVKIMRQIFEQAKEVVIWLRSPEPVSASNLLLACQWLDEKMASRGDGEMSTSSLASSFLLDHPSVTWDAPFHRIASSTWFQRVWIVQEAVLAKNLVFNFGNTRISWDSMCSATLRFLSGYPTKEAVSETLDQCCVSGLRKDYQAATRHTISALRLIQRLRASWQDENFCLAPSEILHLCRNQQASLPVDKVYGLMGLFYQQPKSESSTTMETDYGHTSFQVYRQFAIWCMEIERNLDVVTQLRNEGGNTPWGYGDMAEDRHSPSSWVGKWNDHGRMDFGTSPDIDLGHARQPANALIPSHIRLFKRLDNYLVLRGFIVDTYIDSFAIHDNILGVARKWLTHIPDDDEANTILFGTARPTDETLAEKLTRTLDREPVSSHLWRDGQLPTPRRQGIRGDFKNSFITERGCLAISYPYLDLETRPAICAVYGARSLLVLRRTRHWSNTITYRLISGDCFIDGFEDGMGIEMAKRLGLEETNITIL